MDEFEIGWSILCLTNALESICWYLGGKGCNTSSKIKRALKGCRISLSSDEEKLIEEAYGTLRSQLIAHSPKRKNSISKINSMAMDYQYLLEKEKEYAETVGKLYCLLQKIILDLLEQI